MPESKRIKAVPLLILLAATMYVFFISGCQQDGGGKYSGPVEKITVGVANVISTALFDIAAARDLFRDRGLDVKMVEYASGVMAADDLLSNKLDFATATEFVFVTKHFSRPDVRIIASIARPEMHEVIARKDRGITEPAHLKGKRIAVTRQSSGDFFLGTFLTHHGIPAEEITFVNLPPPEMPAALASGTVDAAMTWEPITGRIKERLGPNAVYWPGQSGQAYHLIVMTRDDVIKKRPLALERLLRGLIEAERFSAGHTSEAQDILARRPGYNRTSIQSLWTRCDFRVRLDQDLLILMEDEAKWASQRNRLKREMPNYLEVIHWESLKKIRPEAVSIIH